MRCRLVNPAKPFWQINIVSHSSLLNWNVIFILFCSTRTLNIKVKFYIFNQKTREIWFLKKKLFLRNLRFRILIFSSFSKTSVQNIQSEALQTLYVTIGVRQVNTSVWVKVYKKHNIYIMFFAVLVRSMVNLFLDIVQPCSI